MKRVIALLIVVISLLAPMSDALALDSQENAEARAGRLGGTLQEIEDRFGAPSWTDSGLVGYNSVSLGGQDSILVVYYDTSNVVHKLSLVYLEKPASFDDRETLANAVADVTPLDGQCDEQPLTSSTLGTEVYGCSSESLDDLYSASELESLGVKGENGTYNYSVDPTQDEYFEAIVQFGTTSSADTGAESPSTSAPSDSDQSTGAEEEAYVAAIIDQTEVMSASFNRFSELMSADNIYSDEWIMDVAVELSTWKVTYQDALALNPPAKFAEVHAIYLEGLSHYVTAADQFAYGVDHFDVDSINSAASEIDTGNSLIQEASAKLEDMK